MEPTDSDKEGHSFARTRVQQIRIFIVFEISSFSLTFRSFFFPSGLPVSCLDPLSTQMSQYQQLVKKTPPCYAPCSPLSCIPCSPAEIHPIMVDLLSKTGIQYCAGSDSTSFLCVGVTSRVGARAGQVEDSSCDLDSIGGGWLRTPDKGTGGEYVKC